LLPIIGDMAKKKLTAASVDRIKPPSSGQIEYFDQLLPSFGLRISYRGTKSWFLMTRIHGKLKRRTFGKHPAMSLADARETARHAINAAQLGQDILARGSHSQRETDEPQTFAAAAQLFMTLHVEKNLRSSTARDYQRILTGRDTKPLHSESLENISSRDIRNILGRVGLRATGTYQRNFLAYLRKFFNWCVDQELLEHAPTDRIRLNVRVASRDRYLAPQELPLVLRAFEAEGYPFGDLFRLLLLTGQRRNECAGMRWNELSSLEGEDALWTIPAERTKNRREHLVPLSPQVVSIIQNAPKIGEYVFTTTGSTPVSGFGKAKERIDRRIEELCSDIREAPLTVSWRLHDLRRTMVTIMNEELGVLPHVVEATINHVSGSAKMGVAGVYNRALYLSDRRIALSDWANYNETLRN
jgi:integrase